MTRRRVAVLVAAVGLAACSGSKAPSATAPTTVPAPTDQAVTFGVWGDTPYSAEETSLVPVLVDEMNAAPLSFSVFVGDLKGGGTPCDDALYTSSAETFNRFARPIVYLPGDNEWTDCHRDGQDSIERLDHLRQVMYPSDRSFGQEALTLEQQRPSYPENSRWRAGGVQFIGLHVPGSNNNHVADPQAPETGTNRGPGERQAAEAEYVARDQAVRDWLRSGFDAAASAGSGAVVVLMQADPRFEVAPAERAANRLDGYDRLLAALVVEAKAFAKPVVIVHGDSHQFRRDTPLFDEATGQPVGNVTRVETFGSPRVGWVEITLDPAGPEPVRVVAHPVRRLPPG